MRLSLQLSLFLGFLALSSSRCHADAVRLKITGPGGKPIANAKVRILEISVSRVSNTAPKSLPALDLTSDKTGVVSFQSKKPFLSTDGKGPAVDAGSVVIANVRSQGLATLVTQLKAGNNALALQAGRTLEGVALDAGQKPIKGAHLRLSQFTAIAMGQLIERKELPESVTDASGRFRFDSLPTRGEVEIEVDDAVWKHESFPLDLSQQAPPPLFLERGNTIKGRLLKPDGSPAPGISFGVGRFDYQRRVTTRANGTFEATGLSDDNVYLQITDPKLSFVVDPKPINDLIPGEVRNIGDWKGKPGVHARGRVLDFDTEKPLANADVRIWGHTDGFDQTNAQGDFDILMAPGGSMITAQAPGYVPLTNPGVGDAKNGVIEIGTLYLKRGKTLSGILLNEKGDAISNYTLTVRKKNGTMGDEYARTGADGRFSLIGLDAGEYTIRVDRYKVTQGAKFTVVSGNKTPTASLRVVATANTPPGTKPGDEKSFTQQTITGRVEDLDGALIAGAKIAFRFVGPQNSYQELQMLSQGDGSLSKTFPTIFFGPSRQLKITGIFRPGYVLSGTQVTSENNNWQVKIKMQPKGAALRGRVLNAAGQGVPHAFVGVQSGTDLPVATDENGDFTLKDVPLEAITLLVSNGPALASYDVTKAGQKVEIVLPDVAPTTEADKAAAADTLLQNATLDWEWKDQWDALGQQRIEYVITHGGIGGNKGEWPWGQYLVELSRRDPKALVAREAELRAATSPNNRALFERLLMLCAATYGSDEQKTMVRDYLEQEGNAKREISTATVTDLLNLAEISAHLGPKTAQVWLDYAGQIADQLPDYGGDAAQGWGRTIAQTKKDAPLSFGDGWKPTVELMLLNSAMYVYEETGDLENARRAYERSKKLLALTAQKSVTDIKTKPYGSRPSELMQQTTALYARILSRTDPLAALSLSPTMGDGERRKTLAIIARNAIALKKFDAAKKIIEATFQAPYANIEHFAEAATLAEQFDPAYAQTLWPRVYAKARPLRANSDEGWQPSLGVYAGARAAQFPGQSRILIEREWQHRLDQTKKSTSEGNESDNDFAEGGAAMSSLVEAMARVHLPRALEMLPTITERNNLRDHTQLKLAISLLQSPLPAK